MKSPVRRKPSRRSTWWKWVVVIGVLALIGFGVSQMSSIAYTEREIRVVDFSLLDARQKRTALEAANQARCTCGCGMTLAQCVATDSTCPVREGNIEKIKTMVARAARPSS